MGSRRTVRCSRNHLFSTIWLPYVSFKAVRLGTRRVQRCPVCRAWRIVVPAPDETLTAEERAAAESLLDSRIP